jgi:ADP-heptose:LPS heptosyltransferase
MSGAVLVARLDNCGDVLLAGPAVRAAAAGGRPVHLLCGPRGRAAAELLPGVTSLIEMRAPWIEPDRMPVRRHDADALIERVRALGVTDAAVLVSSHQSPLPLALLLRWAGVRRIAAVSHEHAGSLLDVRVPGDPDVHEVERGLLVIRALGLPPLDDDRLRVDLGPDDEPLPVPADRPYVVVHPGSSAPARTLGADQWRNIAHTVSTTHLSVVVTGSEEESGLSAAVAGDQPDVLDLGGSLTWRQLGRVLASAAAVVTGNTGPMHLAAAVGTPVVAAFPPTVPVERWRPWRVPHVILGDQGVPCAHCRSRVCPLDDQVCVSALRGTDVVEALQALEAQAVDAGAQA